ncbi:MAG: hypothetical protein QM751_04090 [Paludibacteraceae bacterium]
MGIPFTLKGRMEFGVGYAFLADHYIQGITERDTRLRTDRSTYSIANVFSQIESNTLNKIMYPTLGSKTFVSLQGVYGMESFKSANTPAQNVSGIQDWWIIFKANHEHHFPVTSKFVLGSFAEFLVSTRKFSQNYRATIIQAPSFEHTLHSHTISNEAFSANQYVTAGIKPIFKITESIQIRNETYGFLPYRNILQEVNNTTIYSKPFSSFQYLSEVSLVFDIFKVASISAFANYYSAGPSQWNFGINIGCLMFGYKFLE